VQAKLVRIIAKGLGIKATKLSFSKMTSKEGTGTGRVKQITCRIQRVHGVNKKFKRKLEKSLFTYKLATNLIIAR
jgi:hypothetical protein